MTAAATPIFKATPKQETFWRAALSGQYIYLAYGGAIRGGKTYLVLALAIALCRIFPGSRWVVVRKDLPTLKRNIFPTFEKIRPRSFLGPISGSSSESPWTSTATNGSRIIFFPESVKEDPELTRWTGLECNGAILEEAPELSERTFYKAQERIGTWILPEGARQPPPLLLATCNPFPGWFKKIFYDPFKRGTLKPPYFFLEAKAEDNPYTPEATREAWKNMPAREYNRFVRGQWDDMQGLALDELDARVHLINAFEVPDHWEVFGGFDWGYRHPWSFGWYAVNEDGDVFLVETVRGRMMKDEGIVERIKANIPPGLSIERLSYVSAGTDCFQRYEARSRGDNTPTTAERFADHGLILTEANTARAAGLKNFQDYLAWAPVLDPDSGAVLVEERTPRFRILRTRNNLEVFDRLASIVTDPNDVLDALKVDADADGNGGDDDYDQTRYALASRPSPALTTYETEPVSAWSPETLAFEADRLRRGQPLPSAVSPRKKKSRDLAAESGY